MASSEIVALLVGVVLVVASAWLPPRLTRVVGSLLLAGVAVLALRFLLGVAVAAVLSLLLGAAAYRYAPLIVLRRVTFLVPALLLLTYATTLLMFLAPGNPFANERAASPQVEAALRAQYGVPDNAGEFFGIYLRRLLVEGTLGPSIKVQGRSVEDLIGPAFPVSLSLGLLALLLSVALGLVLGVRAGLKPNQFADHASMGVALIGISLPNFVIGAMFMIVFALWLRVLPVAGWGSYAHLIMPALTLALPSAAVIARLARSGTVEVMQQDFVRTARAKGLPESAVIGRHVLRAAIIPVVSYLGPAAATVMTGSFVVEVLFSVPGMGQWFVKGAINRDYSVVLGTALVYFGLITAFNLLVDLAYAWLDPRVRERA
ncbi:MAG TPA: ABC transporter permease [Polyangiaceae bacterium]|nr:ABC transporter permease [Polyangiaceae bacterium]